MILKRIKVRNDIVEPTNCYLLVDENAKEAMVIDPGGEADKIASMIEILNVKIKYIYLTHCHADHIGAVKQIQDRFGGKLLIHRNGKENLENIEVNLSEKVMNRDIFIEANSRIDDGDKIHIGDIELEVIYTPGHTNDSTSLYCKEYNLLFTGDTMFNGTWGRTDLPTSDFASIIDSITNKLLKLPDNTIVYPGHGRSTIIKEEKPIYLELKPKEY